MLQTCWHVLLAGDDHPPGGDVLALGGRSCHGGGRHVWKGGDRGNIGDVLQAPSELRLLRTTFHSCCAIASELLRIHVFLYLRTFLLPSRRKRSAGGQTWWLRPARNTWVDMSCQTGTSNTLRKFTHLTKPTGQQAGTGRVFYFG